MTGKVVYLAGPISGCTDAEAFDWRCDMTARLRIAGHDVVSPMSRDYRGHEDERVDEIVIGDKADIDASHVVIAFCPKPSVGTSMEILYAWERGRRVVIFAPEGAPVSPWLRFHSHAICHDAADAAEAV